MLIPGISLQTFSQTQAPRIVTIPGWDPNVSPTAYTAIDTLFTVIQHKDSAARAANPNTIYELKRGQAYLCVTAISSIGYNLQIRAEQGTGTLPLLRLWPTATGGFGHDILDIYGNATIENLTIDCEAPNNGIRPRGVRCFGNKSRVTFSGCEIENDRGAGVSIYGADSMSLFISDCKFGNIGHWESVGGNGRVVDVRNELGSKYVDTLVIQNSTFYTFTDRCIRNLGNIYNYIKLDHTTSVDFEGYGGFIQLGKFKTAIITNNLVRNPVEYGDNKWGARSAELTNPEKKFFGISVDTPFVKPSIHLEIRNNNFFTEQEFQYFYQSTYKSSIGKDTVNAVPILSDWVKTVLGPDTVNAYFAEPLTFQNVCTAPLAFVEAVYKNFNANTFPQNWCYSQIDNINVPKIDSINVSYDTTSRSYTAADNGCPVGDMNAFPGMKVKCGYSLGISEKKLPDINLRIFPNPFTSNIYVSFDQTQKGIVKFDIYDISSRLINNFMFADSSPGNHSFTLDINQMQLKAGLYFIRVITPDGVTIRKLEKSNK